MPAVRIVVDTACDHHDVIGDRGQRYELLDPADLETASCRTDFGLADLKVGTAGLLGGADAQHGFAPDRGVGDGLEVVGLAESAQDRDRRVVQADADADAGRAEMAQVVGEFEQLADIGLRPGRPTCR